MQMELLNVAASMPSKRPLVTIAMKFVSMVHDNAWCSTSLHSLTSYIRGDRSGQCPWCRCGNALILLLCIVVIMRMWQRIDLHRQYCACLWRPEGCNSTNNRCGGRGSVRQGQRTAGAAYFRGTPEDSRLHQRFGRGQRRADHLWENTLPIVCP
jgi:hypothetical protein